MAKIYKTIGDVSAYAAVKKYGYIEAKDEREFAEQLIEALRSGGYAEQAAQSASDAESAKDDAESAKDQAEAMLSVITSEFNSSVTYPVGSYCFHEGNLYECVEEHTGAWNGSHFSQAVVGEQLADLRIELDDAVSDIADVKSDLEQLGLTDPMKVALLDCFRNVAWISESGQEYYNALEDALYPNEYPKITAVFDAGANVIYTDDSIESLKQYLTVTYYETDQSEGTTIASADYSVSGSLVVGTSTIRVLYNNLSTTVTIYNVVDYYNIFNWSTTDRLAKLNRLAGNYPLSDGTTYTAQFGDVDSSRAGVVALRGKKSILYNSNHQDSIYYPIPVPASAASVQISSSASTEIAVVFWNYDENTQLYTRLGATSYAASPISASMRANTKFVTINTKLLSTDYTVVFSE